MNNVNNYKLIVPTMATKMIYFVQFHDSTCYHKQIRRFDHLPEIEFNCYTDIVFFVLVLLLSELAGNIRSFVSTLFIKSGLHCKRFAPLRNLYFYCLKSKKTI